MKNKSLGHHKHEKKEMDRQYDGCNHYMVNSTKQRIDGKNRKRRPRRKQFIHQGVEEKNEELEVINR